MPVPGENPELDAETRVPLLIGMSVAFLAVSTTAVLLRLYTRYIVVKSSGPDDITIAIAQILSVGVSVTTILQAEYGLGRHVWLVGESENLAQLKSFFSAMLVYNLAQIITKMSFLLQYRRIFQDKFTRIACLVLMVFLGIWGVVQEVLVGFSCFPVSVLIPSHAAVCIDSLTVWYLTSIMNIVTDFLVFMVPMPAIRGLQLRKKQKILVTSVFCLGFFTCVISIVRLFTLRGAVDSKDPTWDNVPSAYLSVVELNTGILCASLPPLRPLIRHVFPWLSTRTLTYEERSGKTGGHSSHRRSAALAIIKGGPSAGVYALRDVESTASGSREGLKDESASWYNHRESDYGVTSGPGGGGGYQVRTNIKGGPSPGARAEKGLPDLPAAGSRQHDNHSDDVRDWNARPQQPRIMVTREVGISQGSRRPGGNGYRR